MRAGERKQLRTQAALRARKRSVVWAATVMLLTGTVMPAAAQPSSPAGGAAALDQDADAVVDEAPVEMPASAAESAAGAASSEPDPEDDELVLPPPEVMAKFPMFVTALSKTTLTLQNPQHRYRMDKWMPETFLGILFIGRVHKNLGITAAIFGMAQPQVLELPNFSTGKFLDFLAVIQIEPVSWFNIWVGHVTVPADRSSLSSPFFMAAWRYPGEMTPGAFPTSPKTGTFAGISASNGPTVWGQFGGGVLKYYAGAFLQDPEGTPVYSGRINLSLINPEPGFLHASGYYGKKGDLLAIGASLQSQRYGSYQVASKDVTLRDHYIGGNVDVLFEKKLGPKAVLDFEAAAYFYSGEYERVDYSGYGLVSLLMPFKLGVGRPQLLARYQAFHLKATMDNAGGVYHVIDAQMSYVIKGDRIKGAIGYTRHQNAVRESTGHALYVGVQISK